ncbi:hypothetical protein ACJX0J_026962, partial [Zea mays]
MLGSKYVAKFSFATHRKPLYIKHVLDEFFFLHHLFSSTFFGTMKMLDTLKRT